MLLQILIGVAVVVYLFARRLAGQPLQARRLVVLPAVVTIWGAYQLTHLTTGLHAVDVAAIAVTVVLSVALGLGRGITVRVFVRDGHLWQRYTIATIVVWVASIAIRLGVDYAAHLAGAAMPVLTGSLVLALGVSFLGEAAVVGMRGLRLGAPFAPRDARATKLVS